MIRKGGTGKSGYYENSQHQAFFHVTPLLFGAIASVRDPKYPGGTRSFCRATFRRLRSYRC